MIYKKNISKWLAERISWLETRYKDRKTHENGLGKDVFV